MKSVITNMYTDKDKHRLNKTKPGGRSLISFCVLIAASQLALLRPSWNRKDLHHLSCCQRTLWVSELIKGVVDKKQTFQLITVPESSLISLFCFSLITHLFSIFISYESRHPPPSLLQSRAVQTEGAGAQRL